MSETSKQAIKAELQRRLMERPFLAKGRGFRPHLPRVVCADGVHVSVHANYGAYCTPCKDSGPWSSVELSFPSAPMPELADYIRGDDKNAINTVWGYVPLGRVAEVLASHGGLMPEGTPIPAAAEGR